jgi:hypothetical protein
MKVIVFVCLIALCLATNTTNTTANKTSLFGKILSKATEIKNDLVHDVKALRNKTIDPKAILSETIHLIKDLAHANGENHEHVFGEDSLKTVERVHKFNQKVISKALNTATAIKKSLGSHMLVAKVCHGEDAHRAPVKQSPLKKAPVAVPAPPKAPVKDVKNTIANHMFNAEHTFGEEVVARFHKVEEATKKALQKAGDLTKKASNSTTTAVKNAYEKTSSWLKGLVAHNMMNTEVQPSLAQKLAAKAKSLVQAANPKNHAHNGETTHGEEVVKHITKASTALKNGLKATKSKLTNWWSNAKVNPKNHAHNGETTHGEEVVKHFNNAKKTVVNALKNTLGF